MSARKFLAVVVILLFIGVSVVPSYGTFVDTDYNRPPCAPIFLGPTRGFVGEGYHYFINAIDPDGDDVYYHIDWGDGSTEEWIGPYPSGEEIIIGHTWDEQNTFYITSHARDIHNAESTCTILEVIIWEIIFVDDDNTEGPWNGTAEYPYQYIQDGIDNAFEYNIVFVYNGTYFENIIVNKSIYLMGEDKNTTVIDGGGVDDVVYVSADEVNMTGFTVENSGNMVIAVFDLNGTLVNLFVDAGLEIRSNSNSVFGNIIAGYIFIKKSSDNSIFHNKISSIDLFNSSNNVIFNNNVSNDFIMYYSSGNRLFENNINDRLLLEYSSNYNKIYHNNFVQNAYDKCNNSWYNDYLQGGNFWSDYTGNDYYRGINQDIPGSDGIGDTPYNISGPGNNTDRYPLMSPYGSPFQTLYLGYVDVHFEKESILSGGGGYGGVLKAIYLNVDTSIDELPLTMVYHYTLEMNYSLRFPFWLAPLVAIGLKIKNYSDYSWESMKLLHHGQGIWYGNVTQDINLNLTGFEKGDELELTVDISVIRVPDLDTPGNNESWEWFLRLIYNIPVLKDRLLHNWLLPILAPYNLMFESPIIFLRFQ